MNTRWKKMVRHPLFPVLPFVVISLVAGEFYPLSPYTMYSNPSSKPLVVCHVTDGDGGPLPIRWHTGISPGTLTKKYRHHLSELTDGEPDEADASQKEKAGREVLNWLRTLSMKRKNRELDAPIRLVETSIGIDAKGLHENLSPVATLP